MHTNHPAIPALYPPTTLELMLCQQKTTPNSKQQFSGADVCCRVCIFVSSYIQVCVGKFAVAAKKTYSPICERFGWQFSGQNHFVKHIHQTLQCTSAMSGWGTSSTVVMRLISRSQTDKHIPTDHVVEMVQANNILSR